MSKNKIPFTAELSSIIKSKQDKKYEYFISKKAKIFYKIISKIIPKKKLKQIFLWRISISEEFDKKIFSTNPRQIIELGSGYNLRGFNLAIKNPNLTYIDTDLPQVILNKKNRLKKLCKEQGILMPQNYHLIPINILNKNTYNKTLKYLKKTHKTLIISEGVFSYFNKRQFETIINNINEYMSNFKTSHLFSHETIKNQHSNIIHIIKKIIRIKSHKRFQNKKEIKQYITKHFKLLDFYNKHQNYFYLVKR